MGLVFEDVVFHQLGDEIDRHGGVRRPVKQYPVKVLWNGSISREILTRYRGASIDAECTVFFDRELPYPEPNLFEIERDGKFYKIDKIGDDTTRQLGLLSLGVSLNKGSKS